MKDEFYKVLTKEQRDGWMKNGYIKIEDAVDEENLKRFSEDVWIRLGYDRDDRKSWVKERIHLPAHREVPTEEFMPKAWKAICELVGGEERIDRTLFETCVDTLIINLGSEEWRDKEVDPKDFGNWHIDGDWFRHYLDSSDQGLTVIVLFNDIVPRGGGTFIAPDGIKNVVKWLYDHPEGAETWSKDERGNSIVCGIDRCEDFVELTGKRGDVIIFHPFMPHSASKNYLRIPRIITNPPVTLLEPFNLSRPDPSSYSLVESKILQELDLSTSNGLPTEWKIDGNRKRFVPRTRAGKNVLIEEELVRMKEFVERNGGKVDSMHLEGVREYHVVPARG